MYEMSLIIIIAVSIFVILMCKELKKNIYNKMEKLSTDNLSIKQDLDKYRKNMLEIQNNTLKTNEEILEILKRIEVSLQNQNK